MKKTSLIAIITVLLIGGAFAYTMLMKPETSSRESSTKKEAQSTSTAQSSNEQAQSRPGEYKDYSAASLASSPGTNILFFHAPWCPQCRKLEADITSKTIPNDVTVFKVDYDSNQELRQKYSVTIQTTLVKVDKDGKLVEKYIAYGSPTLASVEANLLP